MVHVSRRALLARASVGAGAGVAALLGGATTAAGSPGEADLANVRLVCSSKRLMIAWYTRWLDTPKALGASTTRELLLRIRSAEQVHYRLLAPLLGTTAPTDDDFTYTLPAGALRNPAIAAQFGIDLEELMLGIAIGAASTTTDASVAASIARVVGSDGQHLGALSALHGDSAAPTALPAIIGVEDASEQLSHFLSS